MNTLLKRRVLVQRRQFYKLPGGFNQEQELLSAFNVAPKQTRATLILASPPAGVFNPLSRCMWGRLFTIHVVLRKCLSLSHARLKSISLSGWFHTRLTPCRGIVQYRCRYYSAHRIYVKHAGSICILNFVSYLYMLQPSGVLLYNPSPDCYYVLP